MRFDATDSSKTGDAASIFAGIVVAADMARDIMTEAVQGEPHRVYALLDVIEAAARWGHCVCNETPRLLWESELDDDNALES